MESQAQSALSAAAVARFMENLCALTGDSTMPIQQVRLLLALFTYGTLGQSSLAQHTGVTPQSNTRNIKKLGKGKLGEPGLGLIESDEDPADGRYKLVRLTTQGHALMRKSLETP